MSNDDEVGYKRPPAKNRFKPGKSGNPSGRPKKSPTDRALAALRGAERIFDQKYKVTVNGHLRYVTTIEAAALKINRRMLTDNVTPSDVRVWIKLRKEIEDQKVHLVKARGKSTIKVIRFVGDDALL